MALIFALFTTACKQEPSVFIEDGKAIRGYDPVAFFTESKPIKGAENLFYRWKDATWLFSTEANKNAFVANPEKYAPQYGGYCAYGCSQGHRAPTDVNTFTILDDKLYLNYNQDVKTMWLKEQKNFIREADAYWKK
jgi:YHS domain-containing protein